MKKLIALLLALPILCCAQSNILTGNIASFGMAGRTNLEMQLSIVSPKHRVINNIFISDDSIISSSDTNGNFSFTNIAFGYYILSASDSTGSRWPILVFTDTTGITQLKSLINFNAAIPQNGGTNYYTIAQINSMFAALSVSVGGATNALIEGPGGVYDASLVTNVTAGAITGIILTNNLPMSQLAGVAGIPGTNFFTVNQTNTVNTTNSVTVLQTNVANVTNSYTFSFTDTNWPALTNGILAVPLYLPFGTGLPWATGISGIPLNLSAGWALLGTNVLANYFPAVNTNTFIWPNAAYAATANSAAGMTTNTIYQTGLYTNYFGNLVVTGSGTPVSVYGTYAPIATIGGLLAWQNTTDSVQLVQNLYNNGASNCWCFTNAGSGTVYWYAKAVNASGFPMGQQAGLTWAAVSGAGTKPTAYWAVFYTNLFYPQIATTFSYPPSLTNLIQGVQVETWGDDRFGKPGIYPFLTWQGAVTAYSNAATIYIGEGFFPQQVLQTNLLPAAILSPNQAIIGKGIGVTVLGDPITNNQFNSTDISLFLQPGDIIENMTILGQIQPGIDNAYCTNLTIINCEIGNTNGIDCILGLVASFATLQNVYTKNVHCISSWDADAGVASGTYDNMVVDIAFNGSTNNVSGGHGMLVGGLAFPELGYRLVRGGTYNVSGFSGNSNNLNAVFGNACLNLINTNLEIHLQGPAFNHWNNGTNDWAIYNASSCTNVNGWLFDNGILTYVTGGTNFTQFRSTGITNFSNAFGLP